jgi:tetratricopeptide (TPR) repeat protein
MGIMRGLASLLSIALSLTCTSPLLSRAAADGKLPVPPEAYSALEKIYAFDLDGGLEEAQRIEQAQPQHPLGYLFEAEARWWKIWCTSAEFKYGMTDTHRRPKLASDQHFFDLAQKVSSLAETQLKLHESAEMHFYAGMGLAMAARLYGLRVEARNTARAGVRAREHFLRAIALDPQLVDADLGLGLYNYYIDTLSGMAKVLRFFMGIPGGSKQEGIRQLERAITQGQLTSDVARFYLAIDLHRYDQQYERALGVIEPLLTKYPSNPLFQLARGDLCAKLRRKDQALASYRAAADTRIPDPECRERIQKLATESLAALGLSNAAATH